jgi:integrase
MRNEEVQHVKPAEWITDAPDGPGRVMRITNYPYYRVKGAGSVRTLPLAGWLAAEIAALASEREWLIPGDNPTARANLCHRRINDWMGEVYEAARAAGDLPPNTPTRTAYDWRKQAGSELYQKTHDILATSRWLGHKDVSTTTRWYVALIRGLPSLA